MSSDVDHLESLVVEAPPENWASGGELIIKAMTLEEIYNSYVAHRLRIPEKLPPAGLTIAPLIATPIIQPDTVRGPILPKNPPAPRPKEPASGNYARLQAAAHRKAARKRWRLQM